MSKKETLWHQRIGSALDARIMTAGMLWCAENPSYDGDSEDEDELNRRAELEGHYARQEMLGEGTGAMTISLGDAEDLHHALDMALRTVGDKPLGIIEATALRYLGHLLGCPSVGEYRFGVSAMFESGNITYTGTLENFRKRMAIGVSFQNPLAWLGGLDVKDMAMEVRQVRDITFDRGAEMDSDLKTVRVSGTIDFTVIIHSEEVPTLTDASKYITVVLDPRQSPAPVQRMPMRCPILTDEEVR